jgi:hypothetical protein
MQITFARDAIGIFRLTNLKGNNMFMGAKSHRTYFDARKAEYEIQARKRARDMAFAESVRRQHMIESGDYLKQNRIAEKANPISVMPAPKGLIQILRAIMQYIKRKLNHG